MHITSIGKTSPAPSTQTNTADMSESGIFIIPLVYFWQHCYSILYMCIGCYLGYPQKEKHRVWCAISQERLEQLEKSAADYVSLAKLLLQAIFSKELEAAERWCCTKSKGRQLLDQDQLRGIRCKYMYMYIIID